MYKMTNLWQKKKSKEISLPKRIIKVNDAEVKKIMGNHYSAYISSRNDIYKAIDWNFLKRWDYNLISSFYFY